jgi:hypothetical protein
MEEEEYPGDGEEEQTKNKLVRGTPSEMDGKKNRVSCSKGTSGVEEETSANRLAPKKQLGTPVNGRVPRGEGEETSGNREP